VLARWPGWLRLVTLALATGVAVWLVTAAIVILFAFAWGIGLGVAAVVDVLIVLYAGRVLAHANRLRREANR